VLVLLCAALALRLSGIRGLVRPLRVYESSMAPSLMGEHVVLRCPACLRDYAVEPLDFSAADRRSVCSRCGTLHEPDAAILGHRGQRVLIQSRWLPPIEQLRWRTIAMRHPEVRDDWLVKRVVGLPGETVELRGGDVLVNGRRVAKSLDEFRRLAIPVCDTRELSVDGAAAAWRRWQPTAEASAWSAQRTAYTSDPQRADGTWSWLAFQPTDLAGRRPAGMLLLDDYPFNQSLSRRLHPVHDLLLRGELAEFHSGRFAWRASIGGELAEVLWDRSAGWVELRIDDRRRQRQATANAGISLPDRVGWELALCDGRLHFSLQRALLLMAPLPAAMAESDAALERLELGVQEAPLRLENVELLRDIYFLPFPVPGRQPDAAAKDAVVLGPSELFVLGDNSPVSADSRQFGPIDVRDILGTVIQQPGRGAGHLRTDSNEGT
jgi:signal peptidase I